MNAPTVDDILRAVHHDCADPVPLRRCAGCGGWVHPCDGPCPGAQTRNGDWTCSALCWDAVVGDADADAAHVPLRFVPLPTDKAKE